MLCYYYFNNNEATNEKIMNNLNTKENRVTILNRIALDGVNLSEFNEDQSSEIIKMYAAVCFSEKLI